MPPARPAAHAEPGPPWHDRVDEREIIVLELERPGTVLPLRDQTDPGRTTVVTPE